MRPRNWCIIVLLWRNKTILLNPWDFPVSLMNLSTSWKHTLWSWDFSPQMPDNQDFHVTRWQTILINKVLARTYKTYFIQKLTRFTNCETGLWGCHRCAAEDSDLQQYSILPFDRHILTFQTDIVPSSPLLPLPLLPAPHSMQLHCTLTSAVTPRPHTVWRSLPYQLACHLLCPFPQLCNTPNLSTWLYSRNC